MAQRNNLKKKHRDEFIVEDNQKFYDVILDIYDKYDAAGLIRLIRIIEIIDEINLKQNETNTKQNKNARWNNSDVLSQT